MTHITRPTRILLTVATSLAAVSITTAAAAQPAAATEAVCGPLDSGKIDTSGDPATVNVQAPDGFLIDGYCVKAGSANQDDGGPVYVDVHPTASVTFGHPTGKAVSHYSVSYTDAPTETTAPETTAPETTVPAPTTTDHEACIPEGVEVTDYDTGQTYNYLVPGPIGVDSCGQPIPDICVDWGDHFSTLWTVMDCTPIPDTTAVAATGEPPAPPTTATAAPALPETGAETWIIAALAAALLGGGYSLTRIARR